MKQKLRATQTTHARPTPVLMWGYSKKNFQAIFDFLVQTNLDPCALIEPSIDLAECNYPLSIIQSKDLSASDYANLPVIIAPGLGYEAFEKCIGKIRCVEDSHSSLESGKKARVFHPCSALEGHQYNLSGRTLCLGFPGSGNVLVQTIMSRLLPKIQDRIYSLPISGTLVPDHQQMWKTLIQTKLNVSSEEVVFLPQDMGHVSLRVTCQDGRFLDLYDINCPHWHTAYIIPGHVLPSVDETVEWTLRGGSIVIVLRNPLDTIVSCAAKLLRPPSRVLSDLAWFRRAATALSLYLDDITTLPESKLVLRYEDLMETPLEQIKRLAEFLGAKIADQEIDTIWSEVGMKPLASLKAFHRTQNHFFRPGAGKWIQYLDIRHATIVEESGLRKQMEVLGYRFDSHQFRTSFENEPPLTEREIEQVQPRDFFHFLFGLPPYFSAQSLIQGRLSNSGINYVSNSKEFAEIVRQLDEKHLADYQASASFRQ
ncbi:MAG: sulfotransferase domain-containing protein [Candidatus Omnitrophota bacterium]|jgi:hypothetical protein